MVTHTLQKQQNFTSVSMHFIKPTVKNQKSQHLKRTVLPTRELHSGAFGVTTMQWVTKYYEEAIMSLILFFCEVTVDPLIHGSFAVVSSCVFIQDCLNIFCLSNCEGHASWKYSHNGFQDITIW